MTIVKICGLRTIEHALVAAEAGADLIGLVFAPSRRQIDVTQACAIRNALERIANRPQVVGLFVNASPEVICDTVDRCGLDLIQLSGDEPLAVLDQLPGYPILKGVRLDGTDQEQRWLADGPHHDRTHLLLDAHVAGAYGGTGVTADWRRAADLARYRQIVLAGGLTPTNVAQAIQSVQPWGVDVSSGIETDGIKDSVKIRSFIAAVRAISQE